MSWPLVQLGDVADISAGNSAPQGQDDFSEEGTPFVRAGSLSDLLKGATSHLERIAKGDAKRLKLRLFPKDSILFAKSGMSCMKGYVYRLPFEAHVVSHLAVVQPGPDLFPAYAEHVLSFFSPVSLVKDEAYPSIRLPEISGLKIPLPPLEEQRRIAGILDQADALRRLRSRALDKLNTLGQAIFHEMFGDLVANERGFEPVVVGDVIDGFETGKNLAGDPDEGRPDGFRVLKISAVTSGIFKSEESKPLPPNYEPPEAHIVRDGDLLFSRANTAKLIGATAFARTNSARLVLPDKLWRFVWKQNSKVRPEFVKALFSSPSFRYEIGKRSSGTSGSMKNIGQQKVMTIPFGLPRIDLQQEFAKRISVVTGQAEVNQKLLETCENLFASLQYRAFKGEL